jgi:hypothetical protein
MTSIRIVPSDRAVHSPLDVYSLAELLTRPDLLRPPASVIRGVAYAGRTTVLAGREKVGKSTFIASAAARLTRGEQFLGQPTARSQVLWLGEEHIGDAGRRLQQMNADPQWVDVAQLPIEGTPAQRVEWIAEHVANGLYDVVVIDTLSALLAGLTSFNDAAENARVMVPLVRIAYDNDAALIVNAHSSKNGGGIRGTTEYGGRVDVICEFEEFSAGLAYQRRMKIRGRYGTEDFTVSYDGRGGFEIAGGELSLDMRVLDFIVQNPGCTGKAIEDAVTGRAADKRNAIAALIARRRIDDRQELAGRRRTHCYYSVGVGPTRDETPDAPTTLASGAGTAPDDGGRMRDD